MSDVTPRERKALLDAWNMGWQAQVLIREWHEHVAQTVVDLFGAGS